MLPLEWGKNHFPALKSLSYDVNYTLSQSPYLLYLPSLTLQIRLFVYKNSVCCRTIRDFFRISRPNGSKIKVSYCDSGTRLVSFCEM